MGQLILRVTGFVISCLSVFLFKEMERLDFSRSRVLQYKAKRDWLIEQDLKGGRKEWSQEYG